MQTRKFDELISYFNRKVAEMNIDTKYKMELLGMVSALGFAYEKELSAQPEQRLDEWCTDCKEYDHENHCCHRFTKVIRQTRRELQDEFVMTAVDDTLWVTVDDVQKVGRVIVDEEKSKFCKTFYGDGEVEQKWIPVTEGLPRERHYDDGDYVEPSDSVLVFTRYKTYYISRYWGHRVTKGETSYEIPDWMDLDEYISDAVVAWMPLPKPWEGDAE